MAAGKLVSPQTHALQLSAVAAPCHEEGWGCHEREGEPLQLLLLNKLNFNKWLTDEGYVDGGVEKGILIIGEYTTVFVHGRMGSLQFLFEYILCPIHIWICYTHHLTITV